LAEGGGLEKHHDFRFFKRQVKPVFFTPELGASHESEEFEGRGSEEDEIVNEQ
jgi:hypothetical protein